jgi:hypothetical protein
MSCLGNCPTYREVLFVPECMVPESNLSDTVSEESILDLERQI